MSKIQKNSKNEKLIDSEEKISEYQKINKNSTSEHNLKKSSLNHSKDLLNSETAILNSPVNITVELGKSKIKIKDFLKFSKGSMLILDKLIKEPLDIFVNGYLIASGEIVVAEKQYGLRITSIKNTLKNMNVLSEI